MVAGAQRATMTIGSLTGNLNSGKIHLQPKMGHNPKLAIPKLPKTQILTLTILLMRIRFKSSMAPNLVDL